jgi:ribosome maturation factor RimP
MSIAHTKVTGLDEARLVALIEPVLLAHGVEGVELMYRTDSAGWVLTVNVEKVGSKLPGEGVTVDLCSSISHDLSVALEGEDLIANAYRLEVGSPGLERALYGREDFGRFEGCLAKVKLNRPVGDQTVIRGRILGFDDAGSIRFETETGVVSVDYSTIATARLVFDWNSPNVLGGAKAKSPKPRSSERDRRNRASKRKR